MALFIKGVIENCRKKYRTTWEMTDTGYACLSLSTGSNPGLAKYVLYLLDPQPGQVIDDDYILREFQGREFSPRDGRYQEWLDTADHNEVFRR